MNTFIGATSDFVFSGEIDSYINSSNTFLGGLGTFETLLKNKKPHKRWCMSIEHTIAAWDGDNLFEIAEEKKKYPFDLN